MAIKIEVDKSRLKPSTIEGRDYGLAQITRASDRYNLEGLDLFHNWQTLLPTIRNINVEAYCQNFGNICGITDIKGTVFQDGETNLITKVAFDFPNTESSQAFLDVSSPFHRGSFRLQNVYDIENVITYQDFLIRYLEQINGHKIKYAHIYLGPSGEYSSQNLEIPKIILRSNIKNLTGDYFRQTFHEEAAYICGQFSTRLRTIKYTDRGIIDSVELDRTDGTSYHLHENHYYADHVSSPLQAAALHGVVASYYNNIITTSLSLD